MGIYTRRSIRKFKDEKVEVDKIKEVVKAGFYAPSAGNEQPWEFVIVNDDEKIKQLADICIYWELLRKCPQVIIVVGNLEKERFPGNWGLDCAAATQNILLEIDNQGLGGVWLGTYPEKDRMERVANIINADNKNLVPFSIIAFGIPKETKGDSMRYNEDRVHLNEF